LSAPVPTNCNRTRKGPVSFCGKAATGPAATSGGLGRLRERRCRFTLGGFDQPPPAADLREETAMAWTTPTLVEICVGLEINGYLPAEF